uniref:Putative acetyltransferase n=1 Tax=viral metagenome TaxID=1070528 RepID=A0A6H1ZED9_9ZZZZ
MTTEDIVKAEDIVSLLICMQGNNITWKSMFGTVDEYQKWLLNAVYDKSRFKVFGVFDDERKVLGYLVMELVGSYNHKELFIHDAFISENHRKNGLSQLLFKPVVNAVVTTNIKRLKWASTQVPEGFWKDKCFGFEVKTLKYYYIDRDEKLMEHHKMLGGNNENL